MLKCGLGFTAVILAFGRFDVFYSLFGQAAFLSDFSGKKLTFADKALQYSEFIKKIFYAPNASTDLASFGHVSWQLLPVTQFSITGVAVLALTIAGFILNRGQAICRAAMFWVFFSALILLVLGWGTQENGLILYSLYFGWAFVLLLFKLVDGIEDKLHQRWIVPAVCSAACLFLIYQNIPAIRDLLQFAFDHYPL